MFGGFCSPFWEGFLYILKNPEELLEIIEHVIFDNSLYENLFFEGLRASILREIHSQARAALEASTV